MSMKKSAAKAMYNTINHKPILSLMKKDTLSKPKKETPFKKQSGVLKTLEDYKLIQYGKSEKSSLKQKRIVIRINKWLEDGLINESVLLPQIQK